MEVHNSVPLLEIDKAVLTYFNTNKPNAEPSVLLHVGCGDGQFLRKSYRNILTWSSRGQHISTHPLLLAGIESDTKTSQKAKNILQGFPNIILSHSVTEDMPEIVQALNAQAINISGILFVILENEADDLEDLSSTLSEIKTLVGQHGLILTINPKHADGALATCAENGFFKRHLDSGFSGAITSDEFWILDIKPFEIRNPFLNDLPILNELEKHCWANSLRADEVTLIGRLRRYGKGQWVIEADGKVLGVIYSQCLPSVETLNNANFKTIEGIQYTTGISQLLALNIFPVNQTQGFGDVLLKFFLEWAKYANFTKVIGVTRCSRFNTYRAQYSLKEYIHRRDEHGFLLDPTLHFHETHGAAITRLVPAYRPQDSENDGFGVLVTYNLEQTLFPQNHQTTEVTDVVTNPTFTSKTLEGIIRERFGVQYYIPNKTFLELGLDSADLLQLGAILCQTIGEPIVASLFFEFPTPEKLIAHIVGKTSPAAIPKKVLTNVPGDGSEETSKGVAIVGLSCRFPGGANTLEKYWEILLKGNSVIGPIPKTRFDPEDFPNLSNQVGGFLEDIDLFDSHFFEISPGEANVMDPQHRILLEEHWKALESAGISPSAITQSDTGVFVGASSNDYQLLHQCQEQLGIHMATGCSLAAAAGRISYFFGLNGPALVIDTACSSSLVAVHYACQSLLRHEISLAFASGINLVIHPSTTLNYSEAGMLSKKGICAVFDDNADGYVRSEGVGVIVLKRLEEAIRDQDRILAVIIGSAVGQSEFRNGLTAPNTSAQVALYEKAFQRTNRFPSDVDYIEAHGTGTILGDSVEWESLRRFYGLSTHSVERPILIGSSKSVIGHCEAAAGIAGLIKVVLGLQHNLLPANANFRALNPQFITKGELEVISSQIPWNPSEKHVRLSAISSFGFSGTIAHVILEESPKIQTSSASSERSIHMVTISSPVKSNLTKCIEELREFVVRERPSLADLAVTTTVHRAHFKHRVALVVSSLSGLITQLTNVEQDNFGPTKMVESVTFTFPAKIDYRVIVELCDTHPGFRSVYAKADGLLAAMTQESLLSHQKECCIETNTQIALALCCLADFWQAVGIHPQKVIGCGIGEFAAAYTAGILSLDEVIRLTSTPSKLLQVNGEFKIGLKKQDTENSNIKFWSGAAGREMVTVSENHWKIVEECSFSETYSSPSEEFGEYRIRIGGGTTSWETILPLVADLYSSGITINFEYLDSSYSFVRLELPTYPFQRDRYWLNLKTVKSTTKICEPLFYKEIWIPSSGSGSTILHKPDPWLAFVTSSQNIESLKSLLPNMVVITCFPGTIDYAKLFVTYPVVTGILYLVALDGMHDFESQKLEFSIPEFELAVSSHLLKLIQKVSADGVVVASKLIVATGSNPVGSSLSGMCLTLRRELPHLSLTTIQLEKSQDLHFIGQEACNQCVEERVSYRNKVRHVKRLVPITELSIMNTNEIIFGTKESYVILGAFGGLGVELIRWMAEKGAHYFVLIGRSAVRSDRLELVKQIQDKFDLKFLISWKRNTNSVDGVRRIIDEIQNTGFPKVSGFFHLAGTLKDGIFVTQTMESYRDVYAPKISAAWNFHLCRHHHLDLKHFVMFSSVAAILGPPGQSNYAGANSFLDALAFYRHTLGLPALSINWGVWSKIGMGARVGADNTYGFGLSALDPCTGWKALGTLLSHKCVDANVVVAPFDWKKYAENYGNDECWLSHIFELRQGAENHKPKQNPIRKQKSVKKEIKVIVSSILGINEDAELDEREGFQSQGFNSLMTLDLITRISNSFGINVPATAPFDYPNIVKMSKYVSELIESTFQQHSQNHLETNNIPPVSEHEFRNPTMTATHGPNVQIENLAGSSTLLEPIAIIGMSCRFPGLATSPEAYWELLKNGGNTVTEIPGSRWSLDEFNDIDDEAAEVQKSIRYGSFLTNVTDFDGKFFKISPREMRTLDPQQLLVLEQSWIALERAGILPFSQVNSRTGVFIGIASNDAVILNCSNGRVTDRYFESSTAFSTASGRVSHFYGFQGPCISLDAACASSLVGVHLAVQSLRLNECPLALVGGVNLLLSPHKQIVLGKSEMLSPDGQCKTFDATANGYVRGEGAGILVLKRLKDAQNDKNTILGVIRGTAIGHSGESSGLTVPSVSSQLQVIKDAMINGHVVPSDVGYVETHGTGTSLGDPIECKALWLALFGDHRRNEPDKIVIGSSKVNIGHLEAAAGLAGLIKVILMLNEKNIPPHINFQTINPHIEHQNSFCIPLQNCAWLPSARNAGKRLAGVNSLGFNGTNAHVIVEEYTGDKESHEPSTTTQPCLLTITAKTQKSLEKLLESYRAYFRSIGTEDSLQDMAYVTNFCRAHFKYRVAIVAHNTNDIVAKMEKIKIVESRRIPEVAFLFTGQGTVYGGMGKEFYTQQDKFRTIVDECDAIFREETNSSLLNFLNGNTEMGVLSTQTVQDPLMSQAALFVFEVAMANVWISLGVNPCLVIGHSIGEFAAAVIAGILKLEDAMRLIILRGKLIRKLPVDVGSMVAINSDFENLSPILKDLELDIGAINSPTQIVVSGDKSKIENLLVRLDLKVAKTKLPVTHAFHSRLMDPILDEFEREASKMHYFFPTCKFLSTVTGKYEKNINGNYWKNHFRKPVLFAKALECLDDLQIGVGIEIGPKPILIPLADPQLKLRRQVDITWLPSSKPKMEWETFLTSTAQLYTQGLDPPNWELLYPKNFKPHKLPTIPTYEFVSQSPISPGPKMNPMIKRRVSFVCPESSVAPPSHPLLGIRITETSNEIIYENSLDLDSQQDYLLDHMVLGEIVFPMSGFLELMLAVGNLELFRTVKTDGKYLRLSNITVSTPLRLEQGNPSMLQVILKMEGDVNHVTIHTQSDDPNIWTCHASGKIQIVDGSAFVSRLNLETIKTRCAGLDSTIYYKIFSRLEIAYGSNFQCVKNLWRGDREALSELDMPIDRKTSEYFVHPIILDNTFQTLVMASILYNRDEECPYIPVALDEAKFYSHIGGRLFAYVTWTDSPADFMSGNCCLVNEDGDIQLETKGFILRKAQRDILLGHLQSRFEPADWFYGESWVRINNTSISSTSLIQPGITTQLMQNIIYGIENLPKFQAVIESSQAVFPCLETLALKFCELCMFDLGIEAILHGDPKNSTPELIKLLRINSEQTSLFLHMLRTLQKHKILDYDGSWSILKKSESRDSITNSINQGIIHVKTNFPQFLVNLGLLMRCGQELIPVLRGEKNPLELLFPTNLDSSGTISATQIYQKSPELKIANRVIRLAIQNLPDSVELGTGDKSLRILEIGAGTGSSTRSILKALSQRTIPFYYQFTDVSQFFLHKAKDQFTAYSGVMDFTLFNIEQNPLDQGLLRQSFDVIIAANVVHATANLTLSLANIRILLKPNGILLLGEAIEPSLCLDITFGLTSGWWRFVDVDPLRTFYPLLSSDQWAALLSENGFQVSHFTQTYQGVLIAQLNQNPGELSPNLTPTSKNQWLILSDKNDISRAIEDHLTMGGDNCVTLGITKILQPDERRSIRSTILRSAKRFRGIIFLWDPTPIETEELSTSQIKLTHALLAILQTITTLGVNIETKFVVVTFGSQSQVLGNAKGLFNPFGATVWGMLRSIRREYPDLPCINIELSLSLIPHEIASYIVSEAYASDNEVQIAISQHGRFAKRLHHITVEHEILTIPQPIPTKFRLVPACDNLIENMSIKSDSTSVSNFSQNEIEVEVFYTGINFRDFLISIGHYPKGYLESFGTDFSGSVIRTGPDVTDYKPGDSVFGFGINTFGNMSVTNENWILSIPPQLTFEVAAGIPSVFATAYYALVTIGKLTRDKHVLIHSGAGGVGLAAIQIARHIGANIYVTASSPAKWSYLQKMHGINEIFQSRNTDFGKALAGKIDITLNSLTGPGFIEATLEATAPGGRIVELSRRGVWTLDEIRHVRSDVSYETIELDRMLVETPSEVKKLLKTFSQLFISGDFSPIPIRTFPFLQAPSALKFMKLGRHIGKLVLSLRTMECKSIQFQLGVYIITGGLGGVGLSLAKWLLERDVKFLILCNRSNPTFSKIELLSELTRNFACQIYVMQSDIGQNLDVKRIFEFASNLGPLRGIFHAAGTVSDGTLMTQTEQKYEDIYKAKVYGSWYLHLESKGHPLDYFVFFSSLASLLGPRGQSNHAAGNAFQDSLGHYRYQHGFPATVINWGAWAEVGAAAESGLAEKFGYGIQSFTPAQAWCCFERIISSHSLVQSSVSPFKWKDYFEQIGRTEKWISLVLSDLNEDGSRSATETRRLSEITDSTELTEFSQRYYRRRSQIQQNIAQQVSRITGLRMESIDEGEGFMDMGMDSIMALELRNLIQSKVGNTLTISPTIAYDHPTIDSLSTYVSNLILQDDLPTLAPTQIQPVMSSQELTGDSENVAVVGMSCRFGKSTTPEEFWEIMYHGQESVTVVPESRFNIDQFYSADINAPGKTYSKHGSFLTNIDLFEPGFFGIPPKEAELMDPQQRLLLELAWEALERAGIPSDSLAGSRTGVFIGICCNDYSDLIDLDHAYVSTGVSHSTASGRISFTLGLQGPSMSIDTACSSSLVAMHLAIQSIQSRDCTLALVGGVNLILTPKLHINLSKAGMLAKDGRCKAFDAAADGFGRGEGVGMVLLKPFSHALRDKNQILGIIRGSGVNQDGASSTLTAPSGLAQELLIRQVLKQSNLQPQDISAIETHGTGTEVGDPIEQSALSKVFGTGRTPKSPLYIGSSKVNVAHTEGAAGICGFIKAILCLNNKIIPQHRNFTKPNPLFVNFAEGNFKIPLQNEEWRMERGKVRRIGVSSFGFSGSNAHIILEEYIPKQPATILTPMTSKDSTSDDQEGETFLFPMSARTVERLPEVIDRFFKYLKTCNEKTDISSISLTLLTGRNHFKYRAGFVSSSLQDLQSQLAFYKPDISTNSSKDLPKIGFVFGTVSKINYGEVCRSLYYSEAGFKKILRDVDTRLLQLTPSSVIQLILGPSANFSGLDRLDEVVIKYVIQYSLATYWLHLGLTPKFLVACDLSCQIVGGVIGGFFSVEDGLRLVLAWSKLAIEFPVLQEYQMSIQNSDYDKIQEIVRRLKLEVSSPSSASNCVTISGEHDSLIELQVEILKSGVHTSLSKASKTMDMLVNSNHFKNSLEYRKYSDTLDKIKFSDGKCLFYSLMEGRLVDQMSKSYWLSTLTNHIAPERNLAILETNGCNTFLEIGTVDTGLGNTGVHNENTTRLWVIPPQCHSHVMISLKQLYEFGLTPDFSRLEFSSGTKTMVLPTYPFHRKSYWIQEPKKSVLRRQLSRQMSFGGHPLIGTLRASTRDQLVYERDLALVNRKKFCQTLFGITAIPWSNVLELMLSASRDENSICLIDLTFGNPLALSGSAAARYLQTLKHTNGKIEVLSRSLDSSDWNLHAVGLQPNEEYPASQTHDSFQTYDVGKLQASMTRLDIPLEMSGVTSIWKDVCEVLYRNTYVAPSSDQVINPNHLNVSLSVLQKVISSDKFEAILVPSKIQCAKIFHSDQPVAYTFMSYKQSNVHNGQTVLDLSALTEEGEEIFALIEVELKLMTAETYILKAQNSGKLINEQAVPLKIHQPSVLPLPKTESVQTVCETNGEILRRQLRSILEKTTGIALENATEDTTFFEFGLNSLSAIEYRNQIQEFLGITLPQSAVLEYATVNLLASFIESQEQNFSSSQINSLKESFIQQPIAANSTAVTPLIRFRSGSQRPMFFFPSGYGLGYCYTPLMKYLDPDIPMYGLNDPQFHDPKNSFKTITEYAQVMVKIIQGVQPSGPYRFCGYCFGGTIALTTATILENLGEKIESVTLLDTLHPTLYVRWIIALNTSLAHYMMRGSMGNVLSSFGSSVLFEALNSEFLAATFIPPNFEGHVTYVKAKLPPESLGTGPQYAILNQHLQEFHEAPLLGWEESLRYISLYSINSDHFAMFESDGVVEEIGHILNTVIRRGTITDVSKNYKFTLNYQILRAAKNNDTFLIEKLLTVLKLNPNVTDDTKSTPLHWAVQHGNSSMVAELIKAGANKGAEDRNGNTPLDLIGKELLQLFKTTPS